MVELINLNLPLKILNDADYIIIPKILKNYEEMSSIIASKFYKEMYEILKNPNFTKYKVMEPNDVFDLVLIKKIKDNMVIISMMV